MAHDDYSSAKKGVFIGMAVLAFVTLVEVGVSLFGKGHLGYQPTSNIILAIVGILLVVLSIYKAYYIIYKFMHMGHEVRGLRMTVLLPTLLLVWAIIAFFNEGASWKTRRNVIQERDQIDPEAPKKTGQLMIKQWPKEGEF